MIFKFVNAISKIFRSTQGIKYVYQGEQKIYERTGGYLYITLEK